MYGKNPAVKQRAPDAVEQSTKCPRCDAPAGTACVLRGEDWRDANAENSGHAHNSRYIAAHVDYWQAHA